MEPAIRLLAEPRKRELLGLLAEREVAVGEIAARLGVRQPTASQHLRDLREAGLVSERREGTFRYYRARRKGLEALRLSLEEFWERTLAALDDDDR